MILVAQRVLWWNYVRTTYVSDIAETIATDIVSKVVNVIFGTEPAARLTIELESFAFGYNGPTTLTFFGEIAWLPHTWSCHR